MRRRTHGPGHRGRLGAVAIGVGLSLVTAAPSSATLGPRFADSESVLVSDQTAFDPSGLGAGLIEVGASSGTRSTLTSNGPTNSPDDLESPMGVAYEADGDVVVANSDARGPNYPSIVRVDPATGSRTAVSRNQSPAGGPDMMAPTGIAVAADGSLLVADYFTGPQNRGAIIRVDPGSGARSILSRNGRPGNSAQFNHPNDLAIAQDGTIYVVDSGTATAAAKVIRVDPQTGARTLVSKNGDPSGGPDLIAPWGIELDADENLLISDPGTLGTPSEAKIISVDPQTGVRRLISKNANPRGNPDFGYPGDLALDRSTNNVYVTDFQGPAVWRVTLATGLRTRVSTNTIPAGNPQFAFNYFGVATRSLVILGERFDPGVFDTPPGEDDLPDPPGGAARKGTRLSYTLNVAAKVRVRVDRLEPGRIVGEKCVRATKANSKSKRCDVVTFAGTVNYVARKGKNLHLFTGVIGKRALKSGSYRATLFATAADGGRSVPVSLPFRIR
jgi:sugar lactone lactonase YvrE